MRTVKERAKAIGAECSVQKRAKRENGDRGEERRQGTGMIAPKACRRRRKDSSVHEYRNRINTRNESLCEKNGMGEAAGQEQL